MRRFFERNLRQDTVDVTVLLLGIATSILQTSAASASAVRSLFERATETLKAGALCIASTQSPLADQPSAAVAHVHGL